MMSRGGEQRHPSIVDTRRRLALCVTGLGAAAAAIVFALVAMTGAILVLGAIGVGGLDPAPQDFVSALEDAASVFYLAQLVGLRFFDHTAELRFVAIPLLLLIGASIAAATSLGARLTPGSARRKMRVAPAVAIAYALIAGSAAKFVPLHLTAHGFGEGVAVTPSPAEAFLLPLAWGLLFASIGALVGAFGKDCRREGARLLGVWAAPLGTTLRVLALALVACAAVTIAAAVVVAGGLPAAYTAGLGQALLALGATLLTLPTAIAAVFVSGFGVPFDWNVNALSEGHGSIGAIGGTVPTSNAGLAHAQGAPGVLALAPVLVLVAVFAVGWFSARRSQANIKLCFANALRAAALLSFGVWLLGLLGRVDAHAGGLLGFHMAPDDSALFWQVPVIAFIGCLGGTLAFLLSRGSVARRRLRLALRRAAQPAGWSVGAGGAMAVRQSMAWRAAVGATFAAVPLLVIGLGPAGAASPAEPVQVSVVPIEREAEGVLEEDAKPGTEVGVNASPETRVINTATVETPLRDLGISAAEPKAAKAKQVLEQYGEMFGVDDPGTEYGDAETVTDELGTHTYFTQMADGMPVYGTRIGVHVSPDGKTLNAVMGSLIPDVTVKTKKRSSSPRTKPWRWRKRRSPTGNLPTTVDAGLRRHLAVLLRPRCPQGVVGLADRRSGPRLERIRG